MVKNFKDVHVSVFLLILSELESVIKSDAMFKAINI